MMNNISNNKYGGFINDIMSIPSIINNTGSRINGIVPRNNKGSHGIVPRNNKGSRIDGIVPRINTGSRIDGIIPRNYTGSHIDGIVPRNNKGSHIDGIVPRNNKGSHIDGIVPRNNKGSRIDGIVPRNNKGSHIDGIVPRNYTGSHIDGIVPRNNKGSHIDGIVPRNYTGERKMDMDGWGKEKGNLTPKFVFLHKYKLEMEANKNKLDMNGLSPLSGYEPKYNPKYWNNKYNIKNNNNCYSYAVNNKNNKFGKPQPGYFARFNHIQNNQYKCAHFFKRILNDIPSVYLTSFKNKCSKGFHKAFFAIDSNKNEHDYHFYRQDNNKLWSHKPGTTNVINYDANYKIIKNPYKANKNYNSYNYDKPCFFFCVNHKFGKTNAKI